MCTVTHTHTLYLSHSLTLTHSHTHTHTHAHTHAHTHTHARSIQPDEQGLSWIDPQDRIWLWIHDTHCEFMRLSKGVTIIQPNLTLSQTQHTHITSHHITSQPLSGYASTQWCNLPQAAGRQRVPVPGRDAQRRRHWISIDPRCTQHAGQSKRQLHVCRGYASVPQPAPAKLHDRQWNALGIW